MTSTILSWLFATETGFWMPRKASTVAAGTDKVFHYILWTSAFFFVGIVLAMVYFAWKYRRRSPDQKTHPISGNIKLELFWAAVPGLLLLVMFAMGFSSWIVQAVPPGDAMEIRVNAKRWVWNFDYPRHKLSGAGELIVPQDRNIKLVMISSDVIHSFYVPEFRIKRDVLPNRYTVIWFKVPSKSLTRLKSVKKSELFLENVLVKMAFAKDTAAAQKLVAGGHVLLNGKVATDAKQVVGLNTSIAINVAPKLKNKLFDIRRSFGGKIKAALLNKDEKAVEKLQKEQEKAFAKASPVWLINVLTAMKASKDAKAAIADAKAAIAKAMDINDLKAAAKARAALVAAEKRWTTRYKLPDWLYADRDGLDGMWGFVSDVFNVLCAEYCGKNHSRMITRVRVVSDELFKFWLSHSLSKSPTGPQLMERYGCSSCHSVDGSKNTGPTFLGLYGRKELVTDKKDNQLKTLHLVDSDKDRLFSRYVRESILKPQAKIVRGFENQVMPTFQGQITDQHISILIDYIKYLKPKDAK